MDDNVDQIPSWKDTFTILYGTIELLNQMNKVVKDLEENIKKFEEAKYNSESNAKNRK